MRSYAIPQALCLPVQPAMPCASPPYPKARAVRHGPCSSTLLLFPMADGPWSVVRGPWGTLLYASPWSGGPMAGGRWSDGRWPVAGGPVAGGPVVRWPVVRWPVVRWPVVRWPGGRWSGGRWPGGRWPVAGGPGSPSYRVNPPTLRAKKRDPRAARHGFPVGG